MYFLSIPKNLHRNLVVYYINLKKKKVLLNAHSCLNSTYIVHTNAVYTTSIEEYLGENMYERKLTFKST